MNRDLQNPLGLLPNPISGEVFVFPATKCTLERRLFFKRTNEIHALLLITKHAYDETNKIYQHRIPKFPKRENTPIKIELNSGYSLIFPAGYILKLSSEVGINILMRQTFVMLYGSFETYLFQLFERSFALIGVAEDERIDRSIEILMGGKWDSKFKMSNVFALDFKAGDLNQYFSGFELNLEEKIYKNPLLFMDELAKVRHRIIHASSILDKTHLISVGIEVFHGLYGVYFLLTEFVDSLFEKRFVYPRPEITPAEA
jgi:hypothetical protein